MTVLRTVIKKKNNNRNYSKRIPNQEKSYTSVVSKAVNAPKKFLRTANKTKGKIPPNSLLHYNMQPHHTIHTLKTIFSLWNVFSWNLVQNATNYLVSSIALESPLKVKTLLLLSNPNVYSSVVFTISFLCKW